eukprot:1159993-Pelagomonas_calceolata.AAC.4
MATHNLTYLDCKLFDESKKTALQSTKNSATWQCVPASDLDQALCHQPYLRLAFSAGVLLFLKQLLQVPSLTELAQKCQTLRVACAAQHLHQIPVQEETSRLTFTVVSDHLVLCNSRNESNVACRWVPSTRNAVADLRTMCKKP